MKKLLAGLTLIAVASLAHAENEQTNGFSYDYVQGQYQSAAYEDTIDGTLVGADLTAYTFDVSKILTENIFVTAGYGKGTSDSIKIAGTSYAIGTTASFVSFGVGYRMPINEKTDFNILVESNQTTTKASGLGLTISDTSNSTPVTATLRFMLVPNVELQTSYQYDDGDSAYIIGGGFAISKQLAVIGAYAKIDGGNSTSIGLRYNF
jgi:hypothetical protein